MNLADLREYCLNKKGKITEEFPFDEETLVFKVFGKMFLLTNVNDIPLSMNLKCDPERAIELRERYPAVKPGYHMNKKWWNTVDADGSIPDGLVYELIDHSYDEVVKNLPMKLKKKIVDVKKVKKNR
ncbi:MAG: MmcQ/YjbR family DNA-binding protein [Bacteroidota bacterium]